MNKQFYVEFTFRYANPTALSVSARLDTGQVIIGQQVLPNKYLVPLNSLDVPFEVQVNQQNRVELRTRLQLIGSKKRFVWGQPLIMSLNGLAAKSKQLTLHVNLDAPQEVVLCSGRHGKDGNHPMMANFCNRRIAWGLTRGTSSKKHGRVRVNESCVFTVYEFRGRQSRLHHLLVGKGGSAADAPGNGEMKATVKMGDYEVPGGSGRTYLLITDVYDYIEECGQDRPGTLMALEFMSHGYLGGPVLENTTRPGRNDVCTDQCPTDSPHGANWFPASDHFRLLYYHANSQTGSASLHTTGGTRTTIRRFDPGFPDPKTGVMTRTRHTSRFNGPVKAKYESEPLVADADPRMTDFLFMPQARLNRLQAAFHPEDSVIRVWGCMWGDEGPRFQRFSLKHVNDSKNQPLPDNGLVVFDSDYDIQSTGAHVDQNTRVRRGDARHAYLSCARRTYAQSVAVGLGRPTYGALPGTSAEVTPTPQLMGMSVPSDIVKHIGPLAKQLMGAEYAERDEAGYARYSPSPPKRVVPLSVLVTGFRPFGKETVNASQETVRLLADSAILSNLEVPSWIDLQLKLEKLDDVDVVWSCPNSPNQAAKDGDRVRGGAGILDFINQMPDGGPDIVVLVGETGRTMLDPKRPWQKPEGPEWIRFDPYARNAAGGILDNEGQRPNGAMLPDALIPLFPGDAEYLETSIPRLSYVQAHERLLNHSSLRPMGVIPTVARFKLDPKVDKNWPVDTEPPTVTSLRVPQIPSLVLPPTDPDVATNWTNDNIKRATTPASPAGTFVCNEVYYQLLREAHRDPASGRWVIFVHVFNHRQVQAYQNMAAALAAFIGSLCEDMLWATTTHGKHNKVKTSWVDGGLGKPKVPLPILDGKAGRQTS